MRIEHGLAILAILAMGMFLCRLLLMKPGEEPAALARIFDNLTCVAFGLDFLWRMTQAWRQS